jgi:aspartyl protease family protein
MPRMISRLAGPALLAGLGLLALRLVAWPVWDGSAPLLRLALAGVIVTLLIAALIGAGFAPVTDRYRNRIAWLSVVAAFGVIPVVDHDYNDWEYARTWDEAPTLRAETASHRPAEDDIVLNRHRDGHYYMDVTINGASVNFMVDTGASVVALGWEDARQVGIRTEALDFVYPVSTAAGQTMAARVTIRRLEIAGHRFENVPALVLRGSRQSLMGMSVLERFESLEIREDRLVLQP